MQNGVEYRKERHLGMMTGAPNGVTFPALPVRENPAACKKARHRCASEERKQNTKETLSAARNGDQGAIETLTLKIWISPQSFRRLAPEDVHSIVDSYFMPYGVECDLWSIMGEIRDQRAGEYIDRERFIR